MKASIKYIGVIDMSGDIHHVEFSEGVNVVTGKSSTGKSAILELFDYCFGSSEFNIPDGVITQNAFLYFTVILIKESYLILARNTNKHYISTTTDLEFVNNVQNLSIAYFDNLDKLSTTDFRKELNKYFKIDIIDTDEDLEDRKYRQHNRKKEAPSYRHFTSFMLQHQNLIANKHALFYRFDEKEKKDQTIEQFKIFLTMVDAEFFPLKQRLAELIKEKKQKEFQKERLLRMQELDISNLESLLDEYEVRTNKKLFADEAADILKMPKKYMSLLENYEVVTDDTSDKNIQRRNILQKDYNSIIAVVRKTQNLISDIDVSISYAKEFQNQKTNISNGKNVNSTHLNCVFCGQENEEISEEQQKLRNALTWFNNEMEKSLYTIQSFESDKKEYQLKLENLKEEAKNLKKEVNSYDKVVKELNGNRSIEEQAKKIIFKIENLLETMIENHIDSIEEDIFLATQQIEALETRLKTEYNVSQELKLASRKINQEMNLLGKKLDFEPMYKNSLNLKFDVETFELYQQNVEKGKETNRVYLRSMGSGANWLYSHISLFTSLLHYFCSLGERCLIPTILFLDQPSQVYFPSEIDKDEKFNPEKLKENSLKEGENLKDKVNEDLEAVTNLYNQLVTFCNHTFSDTGIMPQIIVTDHADNLALEDVTFDSLVRKRWRGKNDGFINIPS
jgi:Protein of unknown function (DUF3732)/AAA domain